MNRTALALVALLVAGPAWGQVASRDFVESEGDYIAVGDVLDAEFSAADAKKTIAFWIYLDDTTQGYPIGKNFATDSNLLFLVKVQPTTGEILTTWNVSTGAVAYNNIWREQTLTVSPGVWTHVAVTYDGSVDGNYCLDRVEIYINGVIGTNTSETAGSSVPIGCSTAQPNSNAHLCIGVTCNTSGTQDTDEIDGRMAYVAIFNRLLSPAEIVREMNCPGSFPSIGYWPLTDSSTQYDFSDSGNNGTDNGTAASTDGPPVSNCALQGGN